MSKFRKGDFVRCIDARNSACLEYGKIYEVIKISENNSKVVHIKTEEEYGRSWSSYFSRRFVLDSNLRNFLREL